MTDIEIVPVWRDPDPKVTEDAINLWQRMSVLLPGTDPEQRASELVYGAYVDGVLASVATADVMEHKAMRHRFAFTRYLTAPEYREQSIWNEGALFGHAYLAKWAREHPEEPFAGTLWTWNSKEEFYGREHPPWWPVKFEPKENQQQNRAVVVGFLPKGVEIWIWWFDHIRV